ncbi:hypothetical protein [Arthrobacter sp. BF1]|uniref:hypothetical protein n=1 Tax=Arthrobacter sp. BF1 TaxID=2821145 RepID=UPI001C4E570E|nr:hypothetical protein [Arthrobacter sp. BF1]
MLRVSKAYREQLVQPEQLPQYRWAQPQQEQLAQQLLLLSQEQLKLEPSASPSLKVLKASKVLRVYKGRQEPPEPKAHRVQLELPAQQDLRASKELRVILELPVQRVQLVLLVQLEQLLQSLSAQPQLALLDHPRQ